MPGGERRSPLTELRWSVTTEEWNHRTTIAVAIVGVGAFIGTAPLRFGAGYPVLYAALTTAAAAFLVVAGLWGHHRLPTNPTGLLLAAAGIFLMLEDLQLAQTNWLDVAGELFTQLSVPFLAHVALAFPSGRLGDRWRRAVVGAAYLWCVTVGVANCLLTLMGRYAVGQGDDPGVWVAFRIGVDTANLVVGLGLITATLVLVWLRLRQAPPAARGLVRAMAIGMTLVAVTSAVSLITPWGPTRVVAVNLYNLSLILLGSIFLLRVVGVAKGLSQVQQLSGELATAGPRDAGAQLSGLLAGMGLAVATRHHPARMFRSTDGTPVPVSATQPRRTVQSGGEVHEVTLSRLEGRWADPRLERALLDLVALHLAREWSADATRHEILRNLHDGAQQRLAATALRLRLAEDRGEPVGADFLARVRGEIEASNADLRRLVRSGDAGPHDVAGLDAHLQSVTANSPIPLMLESRLDPSLGPMSARTVAFVVDESVTNCLRHADASTISVRVTTSGPARALQVLVVVEDDGLGGARMVPGGGLAGLRERVQRVDGELTLHSEAGHGTVVTATLPGTV